MFDSHGVITEVRGISIDDEGRPWLTLGTAPIDSETGEVVDSRSADVGCLVESFMPRYQASKCIGVMISYLEFETPLHGYNRIALPLENQSPETRYDILYRLTRERKAGTKFRLELDKDTHDLLQKSRRSRRFWEIIERLEKIYLDKDAERLDDESGSK